jgi:hypothetical protein
MRRERVTERARFFTRRPDHCTLYAIGRFRIQNSARSQRRRSCHARDCQATSTDPRDGKSPEVISHQSWKEEVDVPKNPRTVETTGHEHCRRIQNSDTAWRLPDHTLPPAVLLDSEPVQKIRQAPIFNVNIISSLQQSSSNKSKEGQVPSKEGQVPSKER